MGQKRLVFETFRTRLNQFTKIKIMKKILLTFLAAGSLISAEASVFLYSVSLNGASEAPTNASPAFGSGTFAYDDVARTLAINISFSGLSGTTTVAHIHGSTATPFTGTAGVAHGLVGFTTGLQSLTYSNLVDLSSSAAYGSAFMAANGGTALNAEAGFASHMAAGKMYLNIHSTSYPGGEIRGFLTAVPEPSSLAMLGLGALALAVRGRKAIGK